MFVGMKSTTESRAKAGAAKAATGRAAAPLTKAVLTTVFRVKMGGKILVLETSNEKANDATKISRKTLGQETEHWRDGSGPSSANGF